MHIIDDNGKTTGQKIRSFLWLWCSFTLISFFTSLILGLFVDRQLLFAAIRSIPSRTVDLAYCCLFSLCIILISEGVFRLYRRWLRRDIFFPLSAITVMACSLGLAVIFETISYRYIFTYNNPPERLRMSMYIATTMAGFLGVLLTVRIHQRILVRQMEMNRQLTLTLLKNQLDPHFTFNSINTIISLIDENPNLAKQFLIRLSAVYRHQTNLISENTVSIENEMEFLSDYLNLIEIRHPGHFKFSIDESLYEMTDRIPVMSIQLLTENAIKHNKHYANSPLTVSYSVEEGYITVKNQHRPLHRPAGKSPGIGLDNLNKRCKIICGRPLNVVINDDMFEVRVPILAG